jgi:hypothetical protein
MLWERATAAVAMVAMAVMATTMPAIKSPANLFLLLIMILFLWQPVVLYHDTMVP